MTAVKPPAKQRLNRQRVVEAAVQMANETSMEAVTLRKLAHRLGVTPMALYKHVAGKDELEQLIATGFLKKSLGTAGIDDHGDWESVIRQAATDLRNSLLEHPAILRTFVGGLCCKNREA